MANEITLSQLTTILENDDEARYYGDIVVGAETRKYYRTVFGVEGSGKRYRLVYVVL